MEFAERALGELHPVLSGLFGHRPQTDVVFTRGGENLLQGGGADAACGVVHHAFEGFLVVEIGDQAEVGDDVLDLFALIERHATVDAVGDVVFAQGILERTALGVGAVENGDLIVGHFFATVQSTDRAGYFCGLFLVGGSGHHENLFAGIILTVHCFFDLFLVVADDAVGRAHNVLRRAVVLFQFHRDRFRILAVELENVVNVGSAERIDALRIVAHHADIVVFACELAHDGVLRVVRVLILIDQDIAKTLGVAAAGFLDTIKKQIGVEEQIVEVEGFGGATAPEVFGVDAMHLTEVVAAVAFERFGVGGVFLREDETVFGFGDAAGHARRLVGLVVEPHLFHDGFDERTAFGGVVNRKIGFQTDGGAFGTQDARKNAVERAAPKSARTTRTYDLRDAFVHFARGFVGESQRQYLPRIVVMLEQIGDFEGEHARLSRSCAGNHQ